MQARPDADALLDYFDRHVRPELRPLDQARTATAWTRACATVLAVLVVLTLGLVFAFNAAPTDPRVATAFFTSLSLGIVALLLTAFFGLRLLLALLAMGGLRSFERRFKHQVIEALLLELDPGLDYEAEEHVPRAAFVESGLFVEPPDRLDGDDLARGRRGEATFAFSELEAEGETPGLWGGRHGQFHGVFLVVDGAPWVDGETIVQPDRYERLLGSAISDRLNPRQQSDLAAVRMDDEDFERQFQVFASSPEDAQAALTARNRDALLELQERIGTGHVRAAFRGSKVYAALATGPVFEASIFRPTGEQDVRDVQRIGEAVLTFVERVSAQG